MRVFQCMIGFAASVGFGWSFVWLAFNQPQAMPYVVVLIATCLLAQFWLEVRSERKRASAMAIDPARLEAGEDHRRA